MLHMMKYVFLFFQFIVIHLPCGCEINVTWIRCTPPTSEAGSWNRSLKAFSHIAVLQKILGSLSYIEQIYRAELVCYI